ncbi:sensor histidine kinase [Clostridia bacterium]|nr:sensor histidine kinase [Clostridia bacterium]
MKKDITHRWLFNTLGVILLVVVLLVFSLSLMLQSYYYNGIQQTLNGRVDELANFFSNYTSNGASEFDKVSRNYIENFPDKELIELMIIDSQGKATITSTGFSPDESQVMPDYINAKQSMESYGFWTGQLDSGENIMAVTRIIKDTNGLPIGAVRYCVSLEAANRQIFVIITLMIVVGLLVIFFVILSGAYFIRSIVNPIKEMSETAKKIAQGDFSTKLDKMYDDEIGELSDTINYMAKELADSDQMKNDFISSVSHELRTPLTAIKGWAETMKMGDTPDYRTMEKGMTVIANETERLTGIVEELLDFSRIQSGRMVVNMDKIDLLAELDEAIYMLRERALSESKHLLYDEPDHVPAVLGDKNRLRQVFINIIDNALKYTPASGVIGVEVASSKEIIKITISDNGCGIPAEHLPKVKEKFYKANQTQRGSGIGLAVADEIMRLHDGTLTIESTEGIGTTVILTLPVLHLEDDDAN